MASLELQILAHADYLYGNSLCRCAEAGVGGSISGSHRRTCSMSAVRRGGGRLPLGGDALPPWSPDAGGTMLTTRATL